MSPRTLALATLTFLTFATGVARAGMPSITVADVRRTLWLSELTRGRLEAISFFFAALLVCAGVIQALWNGLRNDFPRLPRLSYGKACGVVVLWGLLFVLVLTMVSGARELLTPGAWEKTGWTHHLANDPAEAATRQITARHEVMVRLQESLYAYFREHENHPERLPDLSLPDAFRHVRTAPGANYVYFGRRDRPEELGVIGSLAIAEGDSFGADRLVLTTSGYIIWMPGTKIDQAVRIRKQ